MPDFRTGSSVSTRPSVDVTYTQPFDVLADMGDGWRWYRLHSEFYGLA